MSAAFDFIPEVGGNPKEIEMREGDVLTQVEDGGDGWSTATNKRTGKRGLVPTAYVEPAAQPAGRSRGASFNNVYRKDPSGGWSGGKGKYAHASSGPSKSRQG